MTGGLVITYQVGSRTPYVAPLPGERLAGEPGAQSGLAELPTGPTGTLNAYLRVTPDDRIEVTVPEVELGQGITTALAQVLADEVRARWDQITLSRFEVDIEAFRNVRTDDSSSVRLGYAPLRQMAAMAREVLVRSAAAEWRVMPRECEAKDGRVHHRASGRSLTFGALARVASLHASPQAPALLPDAEQKLIGRPLRPPNRAPVLRGAETYGIDVRVNGMRFAQVARPPWFGAEPKTWDRTAAESVPGVLDVVRIPSGVAVVAEHTWAAEEGRRVLGVDWTEPESARLDDKAVERALKSALRTGQTVVEAGDFVKAKAAGRSMAASYKVPFLAHGALEPLTCTAHVRSDGCDLWVGTQTPTLVRQIAAEITRLSPAQIRLHPVAIGGAFGRRSQTDFVREALHLSKAIRQPVQVVWSRADDITGGYFRPAAYHRLRGYLDARGWPVGWYHRIASTAIEGASTPKLTMPYAVPNHRLTWASVDLPLPSWHWRSGVHSHLAWARECFVDELARFGKKDPLAVRRRLLAAQPRYLRTLEVVAKAAKYGKPPDGRAHGIAVYDCFGTVVAQVAEVSFARGRAKVHKLTCAVDCGRAVNPDGVRAQMEGSIAYGLSAALYGRLRLKKGRVQESNFHDYRMLRLRDMPDVDVHIVQSDAELGGAGEPGVPPVAPAVVNAVNQLRSRPVRRLPILV